MIGKQEMSDVLLEFHQRGQNLKKPLAPPPPFEITETIRSFAPREVKKVEEDDPKLIVQPNALVRPETDFLFVPNNYTFSNTQLQFFLDWFFKCYNQGTVGEESYIRLFPGSFWRSVTPPGYSGGVSLGFYGSTWTPTPSDQQGTLVQLTGYLSNVPDPTRFPMNEAHIYFATYTQGKNPPYRVSEHIYAPYTIFAWNWYGGVNNGIGFDLTFHTPGP